MNPKILLGFLGGLLVATGVFYVQSQRNAKVETSTPVAPVVAPAAAPIPSQERPPAPPPALKKIVRKRVVASEPPASITDYVTIELPPDLEPPPVIGPVASSTLPPPAAAPSIPEPPQPRSVTIASGTLVTVRLGETISTERSRQGDSFIATLDEPLVVDGLVIAEKGARANGRVVDTVEAGRVKGLAHLALELASVMLSDGQKVELRTARFEKEGPSSKTEDAQKVGIGAAIGAAIGAIAGGGKGAVIGAASGGAAGGGVVAATRGKPAVLPAETKISFRVEQPVSITENR